MKRFSIFLFSTALFISLGSGAFGQAKSLAITTNKTVVDGVVKPGEYSFTQDFDDLSLSVNRTAEALYLAVVGNTTGWVSVGLGSLKMDGATMFMGFVSAAGKVQFKPVLGSGHSHKDAGSDVSGTIISSTVKESGARPPWNSPSGPRPTSRRVNPPCRSFSPKAPRSRSFRITCSAAPSISRSRNSSLFHRQTPRPRGVCLPVVRGAKAIGAITFTVNVDEWEKNGDRRQEIESLIRETLKRVQQGVQLAEGSGASMQQIIAGAMQASTMVSALQKSVGQQAAAGAADQVAGSNRWPSECELSQSTMPRANWGRSAGVRELTRFPSTTSGASTQSAPAFVMSSRMPTVLVARRPFRIPAETSTQPCVADERDELPGGMDVPDKAEHVGITAHLVGREASGNEEAVEVGRAQVGKRRVGAARVPVLPGDVVPAVGPATTTFQPSSSSRMRGYHSSRSS